MKVILKENVKSLGNVGDLINVSPGYARNFLIPQKKALIADEANKSILEDHMKALQKKIAEEKKSAEELKTKIDGLNIEIEKKVGGNGRLFGTVTANELATELTKKGFEIEKRMIMIDNPIKQLGEFEIKAKIFKDVEAKFTVKVTMDQKQVEEMKNREKMKKAKAKKEEEAKKAAEAAEAQKAEEGESTAEKTEE
jgi:large subunit ribosomal protein L9